MPSTPTPTASAQRRSAVPLTTDLAVAGAAVVCALVLWSAVAYLGGVELEVRAGDRVQQVTGLSVAVASAVAGLLGIGALRLLERRTPRALTIWTVLALVVTVISALGPLGALTASALGTLLALHAVVAAVLLVGAHRSRSAWAHLVHRPQHG